MSLINKTWKMSDHRIPITSFCIITDLQVEETLLLELRAVVLESHLEDALHIIKPHLAAVWYSIYFCAYKEKRFKLDYILKKYMGFVNK